MMAKFFSKYATTLYGAAERKVIEMTQEMVYQTFKHLKVSAPGMDAWQPKELSLFSRLMCKRVADLFNLIEEGAPWPSSTMHARIMYLEKAGALLGEVMSFRPLTISAPLYRAYATMRLKDMQPWINQWMTTEMYARVPGSLDILKFFDQIVREVVYKMASIAGMPKQVLSAYKRYAE